MTFMGLAIYTVVFGIAFYWLGFWLGIGHECEMARRRTQGPRQEGK